MIGNKKVVAVTLARGGSKTIKNKNLAIVGGKSLLERTLYAGSLSKYIDAHYVSSDSADILAEAERLGAKLAVRPSHLATDTASSADAILHFLQGLSLDAYLHNLLYRPDYVVELMCTCPFKSTEDIDACIEKLHLTGADSVVTVTRLLDHHPSRLKYIKDDTLCDFYPEKKESRRQDLEPHAFVRAGGIYAFTWDSVFKTKSRYGGVVKPVVIPSERAVNIDEPLDLMLAELIGDRHGI
jgi:CMP-N,N'-diacetyllegionaminic acid synthase